MKALLSAALVVGVILIGCSKPQQSLTPEDEKLVPVYTTLIVMSEEFRSLHSQLDSAQYQIKVDSLLATNGLTKKEFTDRLSSLAQLPDMFQQFQTKVYGELEHRRSKRSP